MIVKVQRPVFQAPGDEGPDILVYGQGHVHEQLVAQDSLPDWLVKGLEQTPKMFAHGVWSYKRGWEITEPAEWQRW